jgi:hypothetical protein
MHSHHGPAAAAAESDSLRTVGSIAVTADKLSSLTTNSIYRPGASDHYTRHSRALGGIVFVVAAAATRRQNCIVSESAAVVVDKTSSLNSIKSPRSDGEAACPTQGAWTDFVDSQGTHCSYGAPAARCTVGLHDADKRPAGASRGSADPPTVSPRDRVANR